MVRIRDLNGDKKINSDDRMIVGKGTPDWTAGLRNQLNYKNWDLSFFVYTRQGLMYSNAFLNGTFGDIASDRYNRSADIDYWTPDNPSNTYYSQLLVQVLIPRMREKVEHLELDLVINWLIL